MSGTLSAPRLERLRCSRESASGSSDWHAAQMKRSTATGRDTGRNVVTGSSPTTLTFSPTATGTMEKQDRQRQRRRHGQKEAAVTIAPAVVERPSKCRVRRGNGDSDGLRRQTGMMVGGEEEGGFREVQVAQRMGRCQRRVGGFSR